MKKSIAALIIIIMTAAATPALAQEPPDFLDADLEQCTGVGEAPPPGWDTTVPGDNSLPASCAQYAGSWAAKTSMVYDEELQLWHNLKLCQSFTGTGTWGVRFKCGSPENYVGSFYIFGYGENYVSDYFNFTCAKDGTLYQREGYFDYQMTNPQICAEFTGSSPVYYDDFELLFSAPTPTPTPTPAPTPWIGDVNETEIQLAALGACREAVVECNSSYTETDLYVNGLYVGKCAGESTFYPRQLYSDTALLVTGGGTATVEIQSRCESVIAQDVPTFPTPTPSVMHPVTSTFVMPSNRWGIDFTFQDGELPWLNIGTDLIELVNAGNLLYIMGGILLATLVLSWAINKVKNPQ